MDLAKAKTILIVAFLILNVILIQQIFFRQTIDQQQRNMIYQENQEVEQLLNNYSINLEKTLPSERKEMSFLEVETIKINTGEHLVPEYIEQRLAHIYQQQANRYHYSWTEDALNHPNVIRDRETIISNIDSWLDKAIYLSDNYSQGKQYFESYPLFGHEIEFVFVDGQLEEWIQYIPIKVNEIGKPTEVLAASTAMRRLPEILAGEQATVIDIESGYYSRFTEEEIIIIPPVWRFTLDNNLQVSVNALSGQIEAITERGADR